jgi:serine/threonine protein kinase
MDFSAYEFSSLQEGQFTLHRGVSDRLESILLLACSDEYPWPRSLQRLEHEHALRAELDAEWAARPVELVRREDRLTLVLEDPGGEPLERMLGHPMDITQFLRIAVPLAAVVGRVHAQGLIHKDLKPANILVDVVSGSVRLTGFGIASRLPRERQAPGPPEEIAGTFAYMPPEQTGRMNRSTDARSDLYSLGVTLYEMITGKLPFWASDPMEWIHSHIARLPRPPGELRIGIPGPVEAVILRLLSAEDRYQTAAGLEADLRKCLVEWEARGRIEPFPLAMRDVSDRLLIPERLMGASARSRPCWRRSTVSWPKARQSSCSCPVIPASANPRL